MAQKTLPHLLQAAKAAKANTAAADLALASLRARIASGEVVPVAEIADTSLNAEVAKVREEIAREALMAKANEVRRVELNSFHLTARAELDRPAFDAAMKKLTAAAREVFREMARHNQRLGELAGDLRALAPYEAYHGVEFTAGGFSVNGFQYEPLDVSRDVLPAMRTTQRSTLRGVPVAF